MFKILYSIRGCGDQLAYQKNLARTLGARITFFNALHFIYAIFHKDLLFETGMHIMIIKIYNHTNTYMSCLIDQGKWR